MERVSNVDGSFLVSETPTAHMHVMAVIVLEAVEMPDGERFEQLKGLLGEQLPRLAAFRRRVVEMPLGVAQPVWVEDPEFDLDQHFRRAAIPSPGSLLELADFVGDFASRPLERSKPLWEVVFVEGLEGGETALVTKLHHAVMDGGIGLEFLARLFDTSSDIRDAESEEEWSPEPLPSLTQLGSHVLREEASRPLRILGAAREVVRDVVGSFQGGGDKAGEGADLFGAPRTSFNRSLTPHRAVGLASCRLEDLKAIRKHFAVTVNDVVLAACATSLRRYLADRGELPEAPLVAAAPIALRSGEATGGGNSISMMLLSLPVQLDSPVDRLKAIHADTLNAKRGHERAGGNVVQHFTDVALALATPGVLGGALRVFAASHLADRTAPMWNVVVSNIAGSPVPLYCVGARVKAIHPLGPLVDGVGLNFTVLSHAGSVDLGVMACRELVSDLQNITTGIVDSVDQMLELAC
jgi:WS/DGAT/MGAT family acyltransferase